MNSLIKIKTQILTQLVTCYYDNRHSNYGLIRVEQVVSFEKKGEIKTVGGRRKKMLIRSSAPR